MTRLIVVALILTRFRSVAALSFTFCFCLLLLGDMGSKRPFDGHESFQHPYKFSKQFACDEKLISFADEKLASVACTLPGIDIDANLIKPPPLVDLIDVRSTQKVSHCS